MSKIVALSAVLHLLQPALIFCFADNNFLSWVVDKTFAVMAMSDIRGNVTYKQNYACSNNMRLTTSTIPISHDDSFGKYNNILQVFKVTIDINDKHTFNNFARFSIKFGMNIETNVAVYTRSDSYTYSIFNSCILNLDARFPDCAIRYVTIDVDRNKYAVFQNFSQMVANKPMMVRSLSAKQTFLYTDIIAFQLFVEIYPNSDCSACEICLNVAKMTDSMVDTKGLQDSDDVSKACDASPRSTAADRYASPNEMEVASIAHTNTSTLIRSNEQKNQESNSCDELSSQIKILEATIKSLQQILNETQQQNIKPAINIQDEWLYQMNLIWETRKWNWDTQRVLDWIFSLDKGYFKKYEPQLSSTLLKWEVSGDELCDIAYGEWLEAGITGFRDRRMLKSNIAHINFMQVELLILSFILVAMLCCVFKLFRCEMNRIHKKNISIVYRNYD